jgi:hypothetical protein
MDLSRRLREVLRIIGPPQNRTMMQSSGTPIVYRSIWNCGCIVDCVDPYPKDFLAAAQWISCSAHGDEPADSG